MQWDDATLVVYGDLSSVDFFLAKPCPSPVPDRDAGLPAGGLGQGIRTGGRRQAGEEVSQRREHPGQQGQVQPTPRHVLTVFRYEKNKLVFTATRTPNWVEELDDDFDDMNEDIESYRCTCN